MLNIKWVNYFFPKFLFFGPDCFRNMNHPFNPIGRKKSPNVLRSQFKGLIHSGDCERDTQVMTMSQHMCVCDHFLVNSYSTLSRYV